MVGSEGGHTIELGCEKLLTDRLHYRWEVNLVSQSMN